MDLYASVRLCRALADPARLRCLKSLGARPRTAEEIALLLGLAPSTVSFHLKKLEAAGLVCGERAQYYRVFRRIEEPLLRPLGSLLDFRDGEGEAQETRSRDWAKRVLDACFRDGKLVRLPTQHAKRWVVLEKVARSLRPGHDYQERELDEALAVFQDDYCTLRRALVDEGVLEREDGTYRLRPDAPILPRSLRASHAAAVAARVNSREGNDDNR